MWGHHLDRQLSQPETAADRQLMDLGMEVGQGQQQAFEAARQQQLATLTQTAEQVVRYWLIKNLQN